jgi:hypothetical protein
MIRFVIPTAPIERAYRCALWLYPVHFRECYARAMIQSLRDALADSSFSRLVFLRILLKDLIQSLIKENFAMLRETISRPALLYNVLVLMALFTALSLGFVIIEQGSLRQSANDPQLGMATDLAIRLAHGVSPVVAIANDQTDMDASLSAFAIAYDEHGQVVASSAQLNGTVPRLPRGVLDYARMHGEERVTWAPRRDVRIASIIRHVAGPQGGFVLAGRNLREVESRKDLVLQMATLVWLGLLGIIFVGTFLFGWFARPSKAVAA